LILQDFGQDPGGTRAWKDWPEIAGRRSAALEAMQLNMNQARSCRVLKKQRSDTEKEVAEMEKASRAAASA